MPGPWLNWLFSDIKLGSMWPILTTDKKARLSVVTSQFARVVALFFAFTAYAAQAQVTADISKITCEQFNVLPKADSVAIWLSGYYHGGKREAVIDLSKFEDSARNLRTACRLSDNFKRPIMQLIESSMAK